ncbi:putative manganese transporter [Adlercreutzia sp. ZJ473]|uniref:putative manganese transporter n=1 Tax=Adlercreutzia sp. ZJ473 TaxID=2722822 RepID=UPI0015556CDA|nr:putative manganese transporter [Adlercreutzia sp. ZJ473]
MEEITHIITHTLEHAVADTLYLIPFLFVTYVAMEWLEHASGKRTQEAVQRAGAAGPLVGALLGAVPQCGFSAAASTLYAGRVVTLGTLFAVLLSTSDEMLPIFLAEQVPPLTIVKVVGAKVIIGLCMGFVVDAVLRLAQRDKQRLRIHELCERDRCRCAGDCATCADNPELVYEHRDDCAHGCMHEHHAHDHAHDHDHAHGWAGIAKSALVHTAQVTAFIFAITLVLNGVLEVVGEDALARVIGANEALSVLASALVGLIPNCAASVVIAQLYLEGVLGAGAMMAGLLVSAGVGLLVLVRANRHARENLAIIGVLYATGVAWGLIINALGIVF